ncbi:MAG: DUF4258 domain-containing protein [Chloroflexi bacterium]|nr:DUF4258 domain-containing protein [Chloroflexota bacterium]
MPDFELSLHAREMLAERKIPVEWIWRTISSPNRIETSADGSIHYIGAISEHEGRFLRVVVNPYVKPNRIVTVFFDRRLRRKDETENRQRK